MRTHLDLCSGIGGFALAARWLGMQTIGFCEIDPFCQRVLAKNFPGVAIHDDLTTLDAGTVNRWSAEAMDNTDVSRFSRAELHAQIDSGAGAGGASLDLITGGYPCQPFSLAGKRLGAEDDRHLWPYIAALVAELRPRHCLFENVAGHITLGLDRVLADLEAIGYTCRPVVVPACALNAPHRRDRVWLMAESNGDGRPTVSNTSGTGLEGRRGECRFREDSSEVEAFRGGASLADPERGRQPRPGQYDESGNPATCRNREADHALDDGQRTGHKEAEPGLGQPNDGLSRWLDGRLARNWDGDWEYGVPRVTDGCTDRVNKLKALGNAIVPQVAYTLMAAMEVR